MMGCFVKVLGLDFMCFFLLLTFCAFKVARIIFLNLVFFILFVQVGWDESTAGERQRRVSLWEIEPLTTPFLLCPPPLALRSKRTRGMHGKAFFPFEEFRVAYSRLLVV